MDQADCGNYLKYRQKHKRPHRMRQPGGGSGRNRSNQKPSNEYGAHDPSLFPYFKNTVKQEWKFPKIQQSHVRRVMAGIVAREKQPFKIKMGKIPGYHGFCIYNPSVIKDQPKEISIFLVAFQ